LISLNPLKRVNSILTASCYLEFIEPWTMSQSPQTGQFNSYGPNYMKMGGIFILVSIPSNGSIQFLLAFAEARATVAKSMGLNPLKRVNSILTQFRIWSSLSGFDI